MTTSPAAKPVFEKVSAQLSLPAIEQAVLEQWKRLDAFHESNRRRRASGKQFVFYDGPPFATGTPHYGHLLAGTIKDIVPRYWNMRGHYVERRFGWDCHGLPIESLAQQALGLKGTPDINRVGVAAFNEQCRSMVQTYVDEWRKTVTRMGRWVDFDHDYKTMDRDFMESVWWVFKRLWEQRTADGQPRIYKAHRIMPYDPVLTTPLSNFEAGNNYKDVQDPAIVVKFKLEENHSDPSRLWTSIAESVTGSYITGSAGTGLEEVDGGFVELGERPTYLLAWTTTPWTLPANLALCVGSNITYIIVKSVSRNENYILAQDRVPSYLKLSDEFREIGQIMGKDLAAAPGNKSLRYFPLFDYFQNRVDFFRILEDPFVTTGDGTGIVHLAPAYGEDDYRVCRAAGIGPVDPLDAECKFTSTIPEYAGQFCKDADKAIIKRLKDEGKLIQQSTINHSYPFGERTDAPLIYRAIEAWYVRVEDLRERLAANNERIHWVPEAVGANRFGNWLKEARDWNISRNRFWGSCLPVWINVDDKTDTLCFGSVAELEKAAGRPAGSITDLHKHHLDAIIITKDGKTYRRTPEVLDCWFESGAMPYAQIHWMGGADGKQMPPNFPAQFIAEGLDQTRGWFYTLLVLSTALFDQPAFQNVVVNGLVLAEDGQKMSKSKKNYPDPTKVLDEIGADALRAYLIDSPVVRADPLRFSENGLKEIVRTVVLPYWNALSFFTTYASVDDFDPASPKWSAQKRHERPNKLDHWILSALDILVADVNAEMEGYRLYNVVPRLVRFIDDLTNWYIRVSRARFWKNTVHQDQANAFHTLYEVLVTFTKVLAPFMPFLTERTYQELVVRVDAAAPKSVHWCDYPEYAPPAGGAGPADRRVLRQMEWAQRAVNLGRKLREEHKLKVRQPLRTLTVIHRDPGVRSAMEMLSDVVAAELNVKQVVSSADEGAFASIAVKPNFAVLRKRCGPKLKEIGAILATWSHAEVARLEAGEQIECCGEQIATGDVLLQRAAKPGSVVATDGELTVALDTELDDALRAEGLAREFVSVLQQARKTAGLEVSDRITVSYATADPGAEAAIRTHADYIAAEVLATSLLAEPALDPKDGMQSADLNGKRVDYVLAKAARP